MQGICKTPLKLLLFCCTCNRGLNDLVCADVQVLRVCQAAVDLQVQLGQRDL